MANSPKNWDWQIELTEAAAADFKAMQKDMQRRVHKFLTERLPRFEHPLDIAEPLTGSFSGKARFRIGDYRLIFVVEEKSRTIYIQRMRHRREIYR